MLVEVNFYAVVGFDNQCISINNTSRSNVHGVYLSTNMLQCLHCRIFTITIPTVFDRTSEKIFQ
jgi:hypothetical protein